MADISDLPMLHDIDADYSPQYVKLARILRNKIESGEYQQDDILPAAELSNEYNVSIRVTYSALAMLAANRYVSSPGAFAAYRVSWQASKLCRDGVVASMRSRRSSQPIVCANIGVLRQRKGWTRAKVGELMGWPANYTLCAAEDHRNGRQRDQR